MKHTKLLALMTAALTGISAAALPVPRTAAPFEPVSITAHAAGENLGEHHTGCYPSGTGNIEYSYYENSNEVTITKIHGEIHGDGFDVVIPSTLADRPVTKIDGSACNMKIIKSITMPDTVREIGGYAFFKCTIQKIKLSSALEKIEPYAFAGSKIKEIDIPEGVSVLSDSVFWGCTNLTSVSIPGVTRIEQNAFSECYNLQSITMREDVIGVNCDCSCLFTDSKNINKINGYDVISDATDENGYTYPVIDPHVGTIVNKYLWNCTDMRFIKDYSERLCRYVVESETDPWMNDALKARQLHDWLIRHCDVNKVQPKKTSEMLYTKFFMSYAASPNGVGKAVCTTYAKVYTMLLAAAGIESYVIYESPYSGQAWNLVKINEDGADQYYQADVYYDDMKNTPYKYFLKSDAEMTALHQVYTFTDVMYCGDEHDLLNVYTGEAASLKPQCSRSLQDANADGILDYDFDLDGVFFNHDFADDVNAYQGFLSFAYGFGKSADEMNNRLGDALAELHNLHMSYWDYVNNAAPHDVTVARGQDAEFTVTLFGENLHYSWLMYIPRTNSWDYIANESGIQPTLRIPAESCVDGAQYMCIIQNQNGYCIWTNPVTLTVTN